MKRYYSKDQDIRFTPLTPAEEKELFQKAKRGDEVAKEFLIRNHLLFAMTHARRIVKGSLPDDELTSAANYAVMLAYEGFDPKLGHRFMTFLRPFIKGQVSRLWKSKFSCGILDPSVSTACNTIWQKSVQSGKLKSGSDQSNYADPTHWIPDDSPSVEEIDLKKFNRLALARAMAKLPKRDAEFLRLYYVEDRTLDEIGKRYKMTREGVRIMNRSSIKKLRRWLKREEVGCAS